MIEKNPIKILFVEDIPEDVIVAEEVIRRENIEFISENVSTLYELESKLMEFAPDIVVCDYNLPGFTAIDVLSIFKKYYPNIPFIVFTGSISEEVAVDCLKKGADDYILKKYIKKLPFAIKDAIRKKELEALAKRERHLLETIVNYSPVGIVLIDKDEKIIFVNDAYAKMFNISKDEVKGKFCKEFISKIYNLEGKEITYDECPIKIVFKEKKSYKFEEYQIIRKDGEKIDITISIVPILDEKGDISSVVAIFNDITEYKKIFTQLIQSQKLEAIGRLVGGIAHDFNNMLNAIIGFSDLILKTVDKDNKIYRYSENIYKAGNNAKKLIGQLMSFSKKSIQKLEVFNINDLIIEIKEMIEKIIGEDIEIIYSLAEDLHSIKADKTQITQVIMNLVTNARESMPQGGKIYISTANIDLSEKYYQLPAGSYVVLNITDTGTGMSKEVMEHIFEPFFTTKEKGTGLGLATVYGIIKQSNGHISVYSEVGRGTTFKIYLPFAEKIFKEEKFNEQTEPLGGNETVLVLEDSEEVQKFICASLEMKGYKVTTFTNPLDALSFVREKNTKFDLLISDIVMPNMSGVAFYEKLKELNPSIKVLFISGYPDIPQIERQILNKKIFLSKPFTVLELLNKVREVLDKL
ncbi:MAG: response regulator [Thermodesulfovibrio sp.]|nr:response regulator [Thermodesulfovibrio sp.]